jgi:transposase-like protein
LSQRYQIVSPDGSDAASRLPGSKQLAAMLAKDGQLILPLLDLVAKLQQNESWLERDWPSAAGSLRAGLSKLFTINRLGLPSKLRRCLGTTNLIDNSYLAVRERTRRVKHWQNGTMALRWTASAFDAAAKNFRRITGHEHPWMLRAALNESAPR